MQDFRTFLRDWLDSSGWNVPRLSRTSGIADPVIRRWLDDGPNAQRPSPASIEKLAPVLGIESGELLRIAGYTPAAVIGSTSDPRLAVVNSRWESLPRSLQDAILVLASHDAEGRRAHHADPSQSGLDGFGRHMCQGSEPKPARPRPSRATAAMKAEFGFQPVHSWLSDWLDRLTGWFEPQHPLPA